MNIQLKMAAFGLLLFSLNESTAQIGEKLNVREKLKSKIKLPETEKVNANGKTNTESVLNSSNTTTGKSSEKKTYHIVFSDKPFAANQMQSTKEVFTPKDNIYGRVILDRPLKKFKSEVEGDDLVTLDFYMGDTSWYLNMDMRSSKQPLTKKELELPYIDFEIWVNKSVKQEPTIKYFNFPYILQQTANKVYKNKTCTQITYRVRLDAEGSGALNGTGNGARFSPRIYSNGIFTLDFKNTTEEEFTKLAYTVKAPTYDSDYISAKYLNKAVLTPEFVKTLPLPALFTAERGNPYRDPKMTVEEIKKMILQQFNTNEIVYFEFLKPEINADYSEERSEGDGLPGMEKRGNKHFLVVYKDKDDNFYRTMECTVIKYLEYGTEAKKIYVRTIRFKDDITDSLIDDPKRDIHHPEYVYYIDLGKMPK